jgi:hypothetical protein
MSFMRRFSFYVVLGGLVLFTGCSSTTTRAGFLKLHKEYDMTSTPISTRYCGTKEGYDYFANNRIGLSTEDVWVSRIAISEGMVHHRFPYSTDENKWRLYQIGD